MFRLGLAVILLVALPRTLALEPHANPLARFASPRLEQALRLGDSVRTRFALAAMVRSCHHSENLFGYKMLLEQFEARPRVVLEDAAREGRVRGESRAAATPGPTCEAMLRDLASADDELLVLAEREASR